MLWLAKIEKHPKITQRKYEQTCWFLVHDMRLLVKLICSPVFRYHKSNWNDRFHCSLSAFIAAKVHLSLMYMNHFICTPTHFIIHLRVLRTACHFDVGNWFFFCLFVVVWSSFVMEKHAIWRRDQVQYCRKTHTITMEVSWMISYLSLYYRWAFRFHIIWNVRGYCCASFFLDDWNKVFDIWFGRIFIEYVYDFDGIATIKLWIYQN